MLKRMSVEQTRIDKPAEEKIAKLQTEHTSDYLVALELNQKGLPDLADLESPCINPTQAKNTADYLLAVTRNRISPIGLSNTSKDAD